MVERYVIRLYVTLKGYKWAAEKIIRVICNYKNVYAVHTLAHPLYKWQVLITVCIFFT